MAIVERRAQRTREILDATRTLFDERRMRDAQIEDIARAVGINRAIIYRHFTTKEELFAMTLVDYLNELEQRLAKSQESDLTPAQRIDVITVEFLDYGSEFPAFVDCAQSLLRHRGSELLEQISLDRLTELGAAINRCFDHITSAIEAGNASGAFDVKDPELVANMMYTQGLGILNLVTFQRSIREMNSGLPAMEHLPMPEVVELAKRSVRAIVEAEA
ncbi:TetR family transcriptional regulator [Aeromicrobium sp. 636]|uniref:TetR/AcrR family transcriptional regulator n=1 Tax=Aeromicrobium senzhongii TaxID=2663859 RepID=A0A8I0ET33_9ACTN|nr:MULTISPECIES: TetR/AcrR family transcriptional regulator [Aeromicrobium]MBC9224906.1 TetR/AcrR family transcriptional regulator [Aeromicrobium senzhongii]MCQ3997018.1 TetR family transcriptional regulator [Aeromicrobium sp. 636]MTB86952.1 TetR family transcriptional regulator [Aeromicrobium senzhongii]QNL93221.1 TetR/AcrR family transcriptional regulator [Aeromicrobium senzhongii]